jgi:signal transduction histidine kinase
VDEIPAVILFGEGPGRRFEPFGPRPMLVAVLDMDAVTGQVLPALAARHFGGPDGLDYDLDVVRQDDRGRVLWRSRADAPRLASGDAAAGLLDLRFEDLGGPEGRRFAGLRAHTEDTGAWRLVASHRAGSLEQVVASARRRNLAVGFGILIRVGASVGLMVASAQRARRLAERQMEFVAAVSHELRTPVAAICSTSENLADGVVGEPAQVRAYGAAIRDEGRRLGDMIERVLEFAGAARSRPLLVREEVDVATLVDDALRPFAAEVERRGFTLVREVRPGLRVRADALALKRVLHNLVENALKYDAGGRFLAVRAAPEDGGGVRLSVEDHGEGIPAPELSRVFEPFFRGNKARAAQVRGFGLGLALARLVVEAHGGRIDVASTPARGTSFVIHLPPAVPPPRPAAVPDALANPDR